MNFEEYQKLVKKTAIYPEIGRGYVYPTLGLVGEAGEIAEKVKKIFRDNNGVLDEERRQMLKKELGDVLWYLAQLSTELGISFDEVASYNIEKLASRQQRGTLHGDGDNR
ncbi:nucleoside triphosphate pyrophosphohydrolase family protein [Patescibacteria group bacterium]|nr:nucleoside triphosphate pyrophosphohydrolase family protein [Patescibacteria group bacterium]